VIVTLAAVLLLAVATGTVTTRLVMRDAGPRALPVAVALGSGFALFLVETQIGTRAVRVRNALLEHKAEEQG